MKIFYKYKIYICFILLTSACVEEPIDDSSNNTGTPGVFEQPNRLPFAIYVRDYDTNAPIQNAVVEWDRINIGAGSIALPTSGITDSNGAIEITLTVPNSISSYELQVRRAYTPSGSHGGWLGLHVLSLKTRSMPVLNFYLRKK
jgi:hypothetical protein